MLCAYRVFWSPLAKHKACARSRWPVLQKADAPAHKNWVFLSRTGKHKAQSMSTKQPILTKICDFEHEAQSTKHEHKAATKKLGSADRHFHNKLSSPCA
jgi:hypothetical protein